MTQTPAEFNTVRAVTSDIGEIILLAGSIWRHYYPGIISRRQIEYMLARMYTEEVLDEEIRCRRIRYFMGRLGDRPLGFAAYGFSAQTGEAKLHKLYLDPDYHGRGYGSHLLQTIENDARTAGFSTLALQVNKNNHRAIDAYRRNGYTLRQEIVVDIGGGFVMDDYVYAKALKPPPA